MSSTKLIPDDRLSELQNIYHEYLIFCKKNNDKPNYIKFLPFLRKRIHIFKTFSDRQIKNKIIASRRIYGEEEWPNLDDIENYIRLDVIPLLKKASNACLLAVETYNKPTLKFRSEGYIVLMTVAWTSLFHAIFRNNDLNYIYKTKSGQDEHYDLRKCIKTYQGKYKSEIDANLTLLIELRDKIIHKYIPELDETIFGECQACLFNFQEILVINFGNKYMLNNSLVFSLQFSTIYEEKQIESIKKIHVNDYNIMDKYISDYRNNLEPNIFQSPHYSFRVFMIPKVGNHLESSDLPVEFIKYNPADKEEYKNYERFLIVIREKRVSKGLFKAGEVANQIYDHFKDKMIDNFKFSAQYHHYRCAKYFKIREGYKTDNPERTNQKFCLYDPIFKQYIYTQEWINFLINKLTNKDIYNKIMKIR